MKTIYKAEVIATEPQESLADAAMHMRETEVSSIAVVEARQRKTDKTIGTNEGTRTRPLGETTGTYIKPPQHLAAKVISFDVRYEADVLLGEARYLPDRRSTKTLIHLPHIRVTLTAVCAGVSTGWHRAHAPLSIQCLSGLARLHTREQEIELREDLVATLDSEVEHDLEALTDTALLLTFSWTSRAAAAARAAQQQQHDRAKSVQVYAPPLISTNR
jgi:quercetin dioxygenase-like cupin family protein